MSVAGTCASAPRDTRQATTATTLRMSPPVSELSCLELDEECTLLHGGSRRDEHRLHATGGLRAQLVLHLHRFHDDEPLPRLNGVAGLRVDANDEARHRGD